MERGRGEEGRERIRRGTSNSECLFSSHIDTYYTAIFLKYTQLQKNTKWIHQTAGVIRSQLELL